MSQIRQCVRVATLALALTPAAVLAQSAADTTPTITIIGSTPFPGSGIDIDKIPGNAQSISASDLTREGSADLTGTLSNRIGSININDNLADQFQPDILFRGFEASPVLGTPQGLAVYQGGVRINEAFGDTVNWDLFPSAAIDRVDVVSSNPVYGLNALGGAVIVTMKNGFTFEGAEGEVEGGSFGQRAVTLQYGVNDGIYGFYIAGKALDEDGWREFAKDSTRQLYSDFSIHTDRLTFDASFTGANNRLFGQGSAPVQELAISRALVFTGPQNNFNQLEFLTLNAAYKVTDSFTIDSNFYYREYRQTISNGDTSDYESCTSGVGLCQSDGVTPVTDNLGNTLPDLSQGGTVPIGQNDAEWIHTVGYGGTVQATWTEPLFDHGNHFVIGGTIDHASTDFQSTTQIGVIDAALTVLPSGLFVTTPEGTNFSATPVGLNAVNNYYGLFATDTFDVTDALSVTVSGRFNVAEIDLYDQLGTNLNGDNRYSRFNPAAGFAYKILPNMTAYAGYSETNRAPTASEIECSNPLLPCLLPSNLASDPPNLKQVVAHTYEAGLRGKFQLPALSDGRFSWNLSLYRTDLDDDIYGISTSLSTGYFQNIGSTRRQGLEASLNYSGEKWSIYTSYALVDATFQSPLPLNSPSNPMADANGNIFVQVGDKLPLLPEHHIKAGVDYRVLPQWTVGATMTYASSSYYRGDDANLNAQLPGYEVFNLHSTYQATENVEVFANIQNLFDARYATFGTYGDPTGVGAPGIPAGAMTNDPSVDNRFQSPAAPVAIYGGLRVKF